MKNTEFLKSMLSPFGIELSCIKLIRDSLEMARIHHNIPLLDLQDNGALFYMNGGDGTVFDWEMNDRLCEFAYMIKDKDKYAFKMLIYKDGNSDIYCYPHGEDKAVEHLTSVEKLFEPYEVETLYESLCQNADAKKLYDQDVNIIYNF